jgi:ankyrin repeat protein
LFYAARRGHFELMKMLIELGSNPDHIDNEGQTPIFYAVRQGQIECIEYLIKNCEIDLHREDNKG